MNKKSILILGDILTHVILTIIGFATHGETSASFLPRMAASFFPVIFGWFVLAPWLGLFDETVTRNPINLLRIPLAMLFVTPLAVILRAAWLNSAGLPIFAFALGGANIIGMLVWRGLYIFIAKRMK